MNKYMWLLVLVTGLVLLTLPAILSGMMTLDFFKNTPGTVNGWLSYWGGYLGSIVGLAAVTIATQFQITSQAKLHKEQLDQQKKAIDRTAELNDRKERSRIRMTYLLNKNEEILVTVIEVQSLLRDYFFVLLTRYAEYQVNSLNTLLEYRKIEKTQSSAKEEVKKRFFEETEHKNKLLNDTTNMRLQIEKTLSILTAKGVHFNGLNLSEEKKNIEKVLAEFYDIIESSRELDIHEDEYYKTEMDKLRVNIKEKSNLILSRMLEIQKKCEKEAEILLDSINNSEQI